jgi:hypothetical protein
MLQMNKTSAVAVKDCSEGRGFGQSASRQAARPMPSGGSRLLGKLLSEVQQMYLTTIYLWHPGDIGK